MDAATTGNGGDSGPAALQGKSWPLTTLVVGQAISGVWSLVNGAVALKFFFGAGLYRDWGKWTGEWGGLGGFLVLLITYGAIAFPLVGSLRLAMALGLHRRRRWARWVAVGLSILDLVIGLPSIVQAPEIGTLNLPGLSLATFTLLVLLRRQYAAKFFSDHAQAANRQSPPT
jgi:hypothetical protein